MVYRKFAADQLFTGYEMAGKNAVLVTDENGIVVDITTPDQAGEGIERFTGILSPGFVNCHCHLELSHMKGMIERKSGMIRFLISVMSHRETSSVDIELSTRLADQYMYERGIVAVGDICNTSHTLKVKRDSRLYYHNFIEAIGFLPATAAKKFEESTSVYQRFLELEKNNASSIVPHAPYSVSDELYTLISEEGADKVITIHNQESEAESEFFATGKGGFTELFELLKTDITGFFPKKSNSLAHTLNFFDRRHKVILVHNVHTSANDLQYIREQSNIPSLYWCLCPNANLYINDRLPDVMLLKTNGCKMVVGTDSLASNIELNILEEIKTLQENFPSLDTAELLRWATLNGAEALRIDKRYGSLVKGKQPGLVNIDGGVNGKLGGAVAKRVL